MDEYVHSSSVSVMSILAPSFLVLDTISHPQGGRPGTESLRHREESGCTPIDGPSVVFDRVQVMLLLERNPEEGYAFLVGEPTAWSQTVAPQGICPTTVLLHDRRTTRHLGMLLPYPIIVGRRDVAPVEVATDDEALPYRPFLSRHSEVVQSPDGMGIEVLESDDSCADEQLRP